MSRVLAVLLASLLPAGALAAPAPQEAGVLRGPVLEVLDAGPYAYLRIKTAAGERWAAVEKAPVAAGERVVVGVSAVMRDFDSPRLKRRFESVAFGVLLAPRGEPHARSAAPRGGQEAAPAHKAPPRPAGPALAVSIAELYARRAELKGKLVRVRGKVVKSNANILGRTWLHLRDGSGSDKAGNADLTVTTPGAAAYGDAVVAEGVVSLDRDLGSGYSFPLLVEDAALSPAAR